LKILYIRNILSVKTVSGYFVNSFGLVVNTSKPL
jgi:hypothetical protein